VQKVIEQEADTLQMVVRITNGDHQMVAVAGTHQQHRHMAVVKVTNGVWVLTVALKPHYHHFRCCPSSQQFDRYMQAEANVFQWGHTPNRTNFLS